MNFSNRPHLPYPLLYTLSRIEEAGAGFSYHPADASLVHELARIIAEVKETYGPIKGVVNGAGEINDRVALNKPYEEFSKILTSKALSTYNLKRLLKDEPLEFACLFSSISSYVGIAGQTDYAAANEVVNHLSIEWNAEVGYPVKAILWSAWSETGLASSHALHLLDRNALTGISNQDGRSQFIAELVFGKKEEATIIISPENTLQYVVDSPNPGISERHAS
jgi:hypothetical protein